MDYWNIALVAQGIEQMTSNPQIQVRVLSRVPILKGKTMENYKYTFTYQCDDKVYTLTFRADISMDELKKNLMYFLRGCSWTEEQTEFLEDEEC